MLTIKNCRALPAWLSLLLFAWASLTGCAPAGPRALLDGERLLREGKYPEAIGKLQQATQMLPSNAQAWNHLGLAYHKANQPSAALQAYDQARRLDLNLTPVRYNLGCLLLEQNNPEGAKAELTAYTLLQSDSASGWLKLGTAQLRLRQLDSAEQSFQTVLHLQPKSAEAWNGLGVIQTLRKRSKEALNCFALALQKQPGYPPALLNLAIVTHHTGNNRAYAMQKYQEYVQANPRGQDAAAVQEIISQLQAELNPPPRREATNVVAVIPQATPPSAPAIATNPPASIRGTNAVLTRAVTNKPVTVAASTSPNRPRTSETNAPSIELASVPAKAPLEPPRRSETPAPQSAPAASRQPAAEGKSPEISQKIEVVQLADEPLPKVAQDPAAPAPDRTDKASPQQPALPDASTKSLARKSDPPPAEAPRESRRVVSRLNPATWFRGRRHDVATPTPLEVAPASSSPSKPVVKDVDSASNSSPKPAAVFGRQYTYRSPAKPTPGDRAQAERYFAQAVQAHRDRRLPEAIDDYRQATQLDPSFFEAYYNLGLAAYELKDLPLSLSSYEMALSINPTSANGRYNFALALEQGGYYQDAAQELDKVLDQHPDETRAHFAVASLYAEKLAKPDLARPHYRRVLELEPQHVQAAAIRFWLASNP